MDCAFLISLCTRLCFIYVRISHYITLSSFIFFIFSHCAERRVLNYHKSNYIRHVLVVDYKRVLGFMRVSSLNFYRRV